MYHKKKESLLVIVNQLTIVNYCTYFVCSYILSLYLYIFVYTMYMKYSIMHILSKLESKTGSSQNQNHLILVTLTVHMVVGARWDGMV